MHGILYGCMVSKWYFEIVAITKPIDFYDASLTKGMTETVKERIQKAEEVLRLRRTKPLKAWESTLDACINLKIKA